MLIGNYIKLLTDQLSLILTIFWNKKDGIIFQFI